MDETPYKLLQSPVRKTRLASEQEENNVGLPNNGHPMTLMGKILIYQCTLFERVSPALLDAPTSDPSCLANDK